MVFYILECNPMANKKELLTRKIIELALLEYSGRIVVASSFGKDSLVLLSFLKQYIPRIPVVTIDTGYEFSELLQYRDVLKKEWKLNLKVLHPTKADKTRIDKQFGSKIQNENGWKCCAHKKPPLERELKKYDAWITGLRRDETPDRKDTKYFEYGTIDKVNPIAHWTEKEIWKYIKKNNLPYNPLYNLGYRSLGCKPCTGKPEDHKKGGRQGKFERIGRANKECGIHKK